MDFAKTEQILARNLLQVPLTHLQANFRVFLDRLEEVTSHKSIEDLMKTDSKEIVKNFLAKANLFKDIEMVLQAISVGCIKLSVESVAEFMVSKYNLHNNPLRSISEENANDEIFLSYNGPVIGGSDGLLREALTRHFNPKVGTLLNKTTCF